MKSILEKFFFTGTIWIAVIIGFANWNAAAQMPLTSQQFVWQAGMANLKEIHLAEVALQKSQDEAVKHFARRMVHDHTRINKKLTKIADKQGLSLPPTNTFTIMVTNMMQAPFTSSAGPGINNLKGAEELMMEIQAGTNSEQMAVQQLASQSEPDFDQAYANQMVEDHTNAVALYENASKNLLDKSLKSFAKDTLPTMREHLRMAQKLQTKLGGTNSANSASR